MIRHPLKNEKRKAVGETLTERRGSNENVIEWQLIRRAMGKD